MRRLLAVAAALLHGAAMAYQPNFDPRAHRDFAGPATTVLVLGTPHLSGLPASFKPETLQPLLDRLAAWRPTIITIENLSGAECDYLRRYAPLYPGTFDDYCWDEAEAEKATGLDLPAATVEARRLLARWPKEPAPALRRHLASAFVAAGDRASALVQWLRLPEVERHGGNGLSDALVALLTKAALRRNESTMIASVLAARLGLERVYPVDDHTSDEAVADLGAPYEAALKEVWSGATTRLAEINAREAKLDTGAATLDLYRYLNGRAAVDAAFASDFGAALRHRSPELYGRRYAGWWETRNLRMVANIRAAATPHPGARVLAIVGASHKGYFEAYLAMMHDVMLADTAEVLR